MPLDGTRGGVVVLTDAGFVKQSPYSGVERPRMALSCWVGVPLDGTRGGVVEGGLAGRGLRQAKPLQRSGASAHGCILLGRGAA
ncbi:MAG: hypothetical protein SynsKO_28950 [Synoicihabitans sp.]